MKWAKTTKYQTVLSVDGELFNILCEDDGDVALSINGEYVCDLDQLPTHQELVNQIQEFAQLEEMADAEFQFIRGA